ncbi:hypothetical protein [Amycolatopsis sp. NPDC059021]|uniref:golvesin C-terminal-like domain-containing protein n=1 Tax=Amycolatopsis sp. NPDC059021 TaxID=3346704 RepID=UPI003672DEDF
MLVVAALAGQAEVAVAAPEPVDAVSNAPGDVAFTTIGDADGFHVLTAKSEYGYQWRTAATLSEPGFDTDRWIGNACLTESGAKAVVVYGPRQFTNKPDLFDRGGFSAVVDLAAGTVTKLGARSSLAYFNPGCGTGEQAVLTQLGGETIGKTRLVNIDATVGKSTGTVELPGDVTSAVPTSNGIVAADGARLVRIGADGKRTPIANATNTPFGVTVDTAGGIGFVDHVGDQAKAVRVEGAKVQTLASGQLGEVGLARGTKGRTFLLGSPSTVEKLPATVSRIDAPVNAQPTSTGRLVLTSVNTAGSEIKIAAKSMQTKKDVHFTAVADGPVAGIPAETGSAGPRLEAADNPNNPVDDGYSCAVPRNDPGVQVYQPTPRQVEWAANEAVNGGLTFTRPANWKSTGLPSYSPQRMLPPRQLITRYPKPKVPPQLLLGILAQESNLWQAARTVPDGAAGNPLVSNYYGLDGSSIRDEGTWKISFKDADCGYGVGQVTDGMRRHGYEIPGKPGFRSAVEQKAIVMDYTVNIAAALQILQDKWNQLHEPGREITLGDDDPAALENWFYAIWAYNSGFYPDKGDGSPWGLGWLNNPVNPRYNVNRKPFLHKSPSDAARPQEWPYPEKVLGFAGNSIDKPDGPGFKPSWWFDEAFKFQVKPPNTTFCDLSNDCRPGESFQPSEPGLEGEKPGPCAHKNAAGQYDLKCWVHTSNPWKQNCQRTCGVSQERFDTGKYPEQPDGTKAPPVCEMPIPLDGAWVIDDVPDSFRTIRPGCERKWFAAGSFKFDFGSNPETGSLSKIDTSQISAGFGGHFWFGHARKDEQTRAGALKTTGTWSLDESYTGWAQVYVHMPEIGAHTQQASYTVDLGNGVRKTRSLLQRTEENKWVALGVFQFDGVPKVTLSNITADGDTVEDVAWDAIAINPLGQNKPKHFIVSLGDSFASGEGSGGLLGERFFTESDNNGGNAHRNACHRSKEAWARQGTLQNNWSIGKHADDYNSDVDFHFVACSGARAHNLLPSPRPGEADPPRDGRGRVGGPGPYREVSQLDKGFLDENTTLVTLSIGGNDAEFTEVILQCLKPGALCQDSALGMDNGVALKDAEPRRIRDEVGPSVRAVFAEIRKAAPNAQILVMGYPRLFADDGGCLVPSLNDAETDWLNDMATLMEGVIKSAVADAYGKGIPVTYMTPAGFENHELCGSGEKAFNAVVTDKTAGDDPKLTTPVSAQSFHPNRKGADLFTAVYSVQLRKMGF